jgi:hypothetical protein
MAYVENSNLVVKYYSNPYQVKIVIQKRSKKNKRIIIHHIGLFRGNTIASVVKIRKYTLLRSDNTENTICERFITQTWKKVARELIN